MFQLRRRAGDNAETPRRAVPLGGGSMICRVSRAEFSGLLMAIAFATSMAAQPASPSLPKRLDAYLTEGFHSISQPAARARGKN